MPDTINTTRANTDFIDSAMSNWYYATKILKRPKEELVSEFEPANPNDKNPDILCPKGWRWLFKQETIKNTDRYYNFYSKTIAKIRKDCIGKKCWRMHKGSASGYIRKFIK